MNARNATREALVRIGNKLAEAKQKWQELKSTQQRSEQALDSLGSLECAIDQSNVSEAAIDAALNAHREWKRSVNVAVQQVNQSALACIDSSAAHLVDVATAMQACRNSAGLHRNACFNA